MMDFNEMVNLTGYFFSWNICNTVTKDFAVEYFKLGPFYLISLVSWHLKLIYKALRKLLHSISHHFLKWNNCQSIMEIILLVMFFLISWSRFSSLWISIPSDSIHGAPHGSGKMITLLPLLVSFLKSLF